MSDRRVWVSDLVTWQAMAELTNRELDPTLSVETLRQWGVRGVLGPALRDDMSPPLYLWSEVKPLIVAQLESPRSRTARARAG
jgi:hypothetical protein